MIRKSADRRKIKALLFDWGNTLMVDFPGQQGPMHTWPKIEEVKNAKIALAELSKKYKCFLATNAKHSSKEEIKKALTIVGLDRYLLDIFCCAEIGHRKPSKDFYDCIADRLALNKKEIVMIGDSPEKDYHGAINAGLKAILYDGENSFGNGYLKINDLLQIGNVLENTRCLLTWG